MTLESLFVRSNKEFYSVAVDDQTPPSPTIISLELDIFCGNVNLLERNGEVEFYIHCNLTGNLALMFEAFIANAICFSFLTCHICESGVIVCQQLLLNCIIWGMVMLKR